MAEKWQTWVQGATEGGTEQIKPNQTGKSGPSQEAVFSTGKNVWDEAMGSGPSPEKKKQSILPPQSSDRITPVRPIEGKNTKLNMSNRPSDNKNQRSLGHGGEKPDGLWRSRWAPKPPKAPMIDPVEENIALPKKGKQSTGVSSLSGGSQSHCNSEDEMSVAPNGRDAFLPLTKDALSRGAAEYPKSSKSASEIVGPRSEVSSAETEALSFAESSLNAAGNGNRRPDFRAREPRQTWTEQNWDETRRPKIKKGADNAGEDANEESFATSHLRDYIADWRVDIHSVKTDFLTSPVKNSEECDINTYTGIIMAPVKYPFTKAKYYENAAITAEMRFKSYRKEPSGKKKKNKKKAKKAAPADDVAEEPNLEIEPDPYDVLIPCHLRPAEASDMEAVAEIYNTEVTQSYKLADAEPVSADNFRLLHQACRREQRPFAVALRGWADPRNANPQLIGFALVDAVSRGLAGSYSTHSRLGGKVTLVVHRGFRRKKIGTALLDAVASSCSRNYSFKGGYEVANPARDPTLMRPAFNPRQWRYLEMDVAVRSGAGGEAETRRGDEFLWVWNFLEVRFHMVLAHYGERVLRDERADPPVDLDRLTFRHCCCRAAARD